jgi:hypothetical protein
MPNMSRTRSVSNCPKCNEVPRKENGVVRCACKGRRWTALQPEKGSEGEERYLSDHGFHYAEHLDKSDVYYLGPLSHIIHLYTDGTWDSDKCPAKIATLEEYLAWLEPARMLHF